MQGIRGGDRAGDRRQETEDTTRDREFFSRVAQSGTWITPTLVLHHFMTGVVPLLASAADTSRSLVKQD